MYRKPNPVKKNMDKFHKPSTHMDISKEPMNKRLDVQEGLDDYFFDKEKATEVAQVAEE